MFIALFSSSLTVQASGITRDNILSNITLLKEIAAEIMQQHGVLIPIKDKLNLYHSQKAKEVWSNITRNMIGQNKEYTYGSIKKYYPFLQHGNTKDLRSLFGKKESTFYTDDEINRIGPIISEAIGHGTFSENTGGSPLSQENSFVVTYNVNVGEVCTRTEQHDKINVGCVPANQIKIVFESEAFFNDILHNDNMESWKGKNLQGSILAIY